MNETWVPVVGFEGSHEVSNLGQIRSVHRTTIDKRGRTRRYPSRLIGHSVNKASGYRVVKLCDGDRSRKLLYVHAVVALAFLGNRPAGTDICHNNGNKLDCRAVNLRYDSRKANIADAVRHGTWGHTTIADKDIATVRSLAGTMTQREIASKVGISQAYVSMLLSNKYRQGVDVRAVLALT